MRARYPFETVRISCVCVCVYALRRAEHRRRLAHRRLADATGSPARTHLDGLGLPTIGTPIVPGGVGCLGHALCSEPANGRRRRRDASENRSGTACVPDGTLAAPLRTPHPGGGRRPTQSNRPRRRLCAGRRHAPRSWAAIRTIRTARGRGGSSSGGGGSGRGRVGRGCLGRGCTGASAPIALNRWRNEPVWRVFRVFGIGAVHYGQPQPTGCTGQWHNSRWRRRWRWQHAIAAAGGVGHGRRRAGRLCVSAAPGLSRQRRRQCRAGDDHGAGCPHLAARALARSRDCQSVVATAKCRRSGHAAAHAAAFAVDVAGAFSPQLGRWRWRRRRCRHALPIAVSHLDSPGRVGTA